VIRCSAPGKIFLSGEYAVLSGSPAVVTAVDRRAVAVRSSVPDQSSAIIHAVFSESARRLSLPLEQVRKECAMLVTSAGFRLGKEKLGLGSSAAVAASAAGVVFEQYGRDIDAHRSEILAVAQNAHRQAQGGKGSGADVAVSVLGGTIIYTRDRPPIAVNPADLHLQVVWTGRSVSTAEMIDKINQFKMRNPDAHAARIAALRTVAVELADAFAARTSDGVIHGARAYARAMEALGTDAEVAIVTKPHKCLINLAEEIGGAAKPSGAGGGDIAVAFFASRQAMAAFRIQCIRHELPLLELRLDAPGLRRDSANG
jgi:phosphomevalonate kinase